MTHEQRIAERTINTLVNDFSFDPSRSREAVAAIGDKGDVNLAVGWLLDHGEEDRGGSVALKRCPHLDYLQRPLVDPASLRFGLPCADGCPGGENWVNLFDGSTRCSRYVKGHCLQHWQKTREAEERTLTVADAAQGKQALGHHLAISLSDLSVWCYACEAYVEHDAIIPHCEALRALKFGGAVQDTANAPGTEAPPGASEEDVAVAAVKEGDPLQGPPHAMHGTKGDPQWDAPRVTVACSAPARPGYRTCAAHEYRDSDQVLRAKVRVFADMLRAAQHATVYTGAGISTASGIKDYATQSGAFASRQQRVSPLLAAPSYSHRALTALYSAGFLKGGWVQQNHDGLPQKAGMPQAGVNEIHGAWFDPSNPVVPMDGTLRPDLVAALEDAIERTDLCLVAGTSLCGMNADRIASTTARRARRDTAVLGTVLINLQRTVMDEHCQLRLFTTIDETMALLASELSISVPEHAMPAVPTPIDGMADVFEVPYDADGLRVEGANSVLDLRNGSQVKITNQPDWDADRCGSVGTVVGKDELGNYVISLSWGGDRRSRALGAWWVAEAQRGGVPSMPVAPCGGTIPFPVGM